MAGNAHIDHERPDGQAASSALALTEADLWFVREVLPLEGMLSQFFRRNCRNRSDIADLRQEVYVKVYEAARQQLPERTRAFVLTTARNILINRVRRDQVVSVQTVVNLEALNVALDEPGPERAVIARDTLWRLQQALDRLPERCRQAVILKRIEGLSCREISQRMGITENTVNRHLTDGMCALANHLYGDVSDSGAET